MEPYPGVFVSASSAGAWESVPEVGGEMHVLCDGEGIQSGLSRFTEVTGPVQWTLPGRETFLVLEGAARIEIDDGQVLELTAGERPAGGGRWAADAAAAYPRSQVWPAAQHAAAVYRHGRGYVVVASKAGADHHPAWYYTCARIRVRSRSRSTGGTSRSARARPKAPSVRNCGGWSMTTTTATRCTSSGRAVGLSRSCCSSQRNGCRLAGAELQPAECPRIPAARSGDYLASPGHPSSRQKRTFIWRRR
jgi:F420H(2)-dependent quinone reductase